MELPYHEQAWGSPPRMRGKGLLRSMFYVAFGITPAYAGKSDEA